MNITYALSYLYVQPLSQNIRVKGLFRKMIYHGYGYRESRRSKVDYKDDTTLYRFVTKAYAANERLKTPWVVTVFDKPQTLFPTP
jgi:ribosomal protein S18